MTDPRRKIGALGERYAEKFLKKKGMKVIERNWRNRLGEIDILLWDGQELVFTEVKTRLSVVDRSIKPYLFDNITVDKKRKLRSLVDLYLGLHYRWKTPPAVRIDLLGVLLRSEDLSVEVIEHLIAAA